MVAEFISLPALAPLKITWELLPEDYPIPDDPVDNRTQPTLAAALTNSLSQADRLDAQTITITNYPVCATVNDRIVLKAPDWAYISPISVTKAEVNRSYTPHVQGPVPSIVMEFISHKDGGEYSVRPTAPLGKWFFYETVLQVPYYAIFEPESGDLEVYRLNDSGCYKIQIMEENGRYWIEPLQLFLGVWQGEWEDRSGYWLRWWDAADNLLLWSSEQAAQEQQRAEREAQRAERETQRADQEAQRAERLLAQLKAAGIEPES
jgi:Uma2 family endonuclease